MIKVKNVKKNYGNKEVLKGIDLDIQDGIIYGIVGTNGVEKTTLLQTIAGLTTHYSGDVIINGVNNTTNRTFNNLNFVPDHASLYEYLTGEEYLLFAAAMYEIPKTERVEKVKRLLKLLMLDEASNHTISSYSNGMRQKVALASAIMNQPDYILLDEPLTGVDMLSSEIIKDYLYQFILEGKTVILTTHLLELAHSLCNTIGILHDGVIVEEFLPNQLSLKEIQKRIKSVYLREVM